jgi:hypothetical protein
MDQDYKDSLHADNADIIEMTSLEYALHTLGKGDEHGILSEGFNRITQAKTSDAACTALKDSRDAICDAVRMFGNETRAAIENLNETTDKRGKALEKATWVLAFATAGVVIATIGLIVVTLPAK